MEHFKTPQIGTFHSAADSWERKQMELEEKTIQDIRFLKEFANFSVGAAEHIAGVLYTATVSASKNGDG